MNIKETTFIDEKFCASDGFTYDGWLHFTLETGEVISIPGVYFLRKCTNCGKIKKSYGLKGLCKECSDYEYFINHDFTECEKCFSEKRELPFCVEICYVWIEANEDPHKAKELLKRFISDESYRKEIFRKHYVDEFCD